MEERATGIILRTRPLTETSLIVHLLTQDAGRIAFVAKGARRPKSPFSGKLDLFYEADVSFSRSRSSELHNLREVVLRETHPAIRQDFTRLNFAAYAAVLVEQGTETETPVLEFYGFVQETLRYLDIAAPGFGAMFCLEWQFLSLTGTAPALDPLSEEAEKVLETYSALPLGAADELELSRELKTELELFLRRGIGTTLERLPPQRERLMKALTSTV